MSQYEMMRLAYDLQTSMLDELRLKSCSCVLAVEYRSRSLASSSTHPVVNAGASVVRHIGDVGWVSENGHGNDWNEERSRQLSMGT